MVQLLTLGGDPFSSTGGGRELVLVLVAGDSALYLRKQQKNVLKILRLLCFFKLLFDWDTVKTKEGFGRASGEQVVMQIDIFS